MQRPATIYDVAARAGVSRQTVSRAVNGLGDISPATRERVLAVARELGYRPSRYGRGLAGADRRLTLGLLVADLTNPYYPEFASATVRFAAREGWNVVLVDTAAAGDPAAQLTDLARQADAVLGYFPHAPGEAQALQGVPLVDVDPPGERHPGGVVELDPRPALAEVAVHLRAAGVRRPVLLDVERGGEPSRRFTRAREAFAAAGLALGRVRAHREDVEAGDAAAAAALRGGGSRPDALLAWNDLVALGALAACRRLGVDVPGEVRVVGVDGLALGAWVAPRLTTLAVDMAQVAREAVDLALALHAGDLTAGGRGAVRRVEHRLVLRDPVEVE
ncbi:LacI family DNA-binding transcriptional regulator, partial [Kineococcus indalonis]|uniref:LacI family DNA-binding transcriptional regulator n=1 Tax=Kineococcus indalonis TaxID=2696566 RepID=UPI00196B9609